MEKATESSDTRASRAVATVLLVLLALFAWRNIVDVDVGLHLAGGRWIVENGRVPSGDPFTWTVPDHPYLAYHWLFQVLLYGAEQALGYTGINLLRWFALMATGLLLADVVRGRAHAPLPTLLVGMTALFVAEWRFLPRPELASDLFLAASVWVCERRRQGRPAPLWLLPVIQLLWVNTHVYALGWGVLGLYVLDEAIRQRSWRTPLCRWSAVSALALLANPYHVHAVVHPLLLLTRMDPDGVFVWNLREFAPPLLMSFSLGEPLALALRAWALLMLLSGIAVWVHGSRRRWLDAAVITLYSLFSLLAVRNGAPFAIVVFPYLVWGLSELPWSTSRDRIPRLAIAALLVFAALTAVRVANDAYYQEARRAQRFGTGWADVLALDAANWVAAANLEGPLFNDHNSGASLLWRTPQHKVFTDGRTEVSGPEFFLRAQRAATPEGWAEAEATWAPELAVLSHVGAFPLSLALFNDPAWKLVYLDGHATVFVRAAGPNGHFPAASLPEPVDPNERMARLAAIDVQSGALARVARWLRPERPAPAVDFAVGQFLLGVDRLEQAEAALLRAAERSPDSAEVHYKLGLVYARWRRAEAAHLCFRRVYLLQPDDPRLDEIPRGLWAEPELGPLGAPSG